MGNPTDTKHVEVSKLSYHHHLLPCLTTQGKWNSSRMSVKNSLGYN